MGMELDSVREVGEVKVKLGLAEKWILAAIGVVLAVALTYLVSKLDKVDAIDTRTQVMQRDIAGIQSNSSDLPDLRRTQVRVVEKVENLEKAVAELQKHRGM